MNTKATAAETAKPATAAPKPVNAPTVKDETKATATAKAGVVKFVPLSAEEKKAYIDLKESFDELDDTELARLHDIRKKLKEAADSKSSYVSQVKKEITESGLSISDLFTANEVVSAFEFTKLFSADELKAQILTAKYGIKDLFTAEAIKALGGKKSKEESKDEDSSSEKGEKWIAMEGRAPKYYKGQVYKKMSNKQIGAKDFSKAMGPSLPKNWLDKDSIEALMAVATDKAKELFAAKDEAFMTEMNDLLAAIKNHADYIAAKGAKAEDKKAA